MKEKVTPKWKFQFLPEEGHPIDFEGMEKSSLLGETIKTMSQCEQDKIYHPEGDVWTHTKMCLEYLIKMPEYKEMNEEERSIVFMGLLLHDSGKPITTKTDEEHVTSKGHSVKGARLSREIIIKWNSTSDHIIPFHAREQICNLILLHMLPIWLLEKEDPLYSAAMASCVVNNKMLATLTMADACGRTCAKEAIEKAKERIELFTMFCDENGCFTQPKQFQTERARFRYFFERKGHPDYDYFEPTNGEVIVMCGLQASGKDHVIKKYYSDWITVGLDQTRMDMDLDYGDDEPAVVQEAREKCKQLMREKKSFVFNATNIVKDIRMRWINLFRQYKYRITIYYKERPLDVMLKANKERENPVPNDVIVEKVKKIDIPTIMECHELITDVSYDH